MTKVCNGSRYEKCLLFKYKAFICMCESNDEQKPGKKIVVHRSDF